MAWPLPTPYIVDNSGALAADIESTLLCHTTCAHLTTSSVSCTGIAYNGRPYGHLETGCLLRSSSSQQIGGRRSETQTALRGRTLQVATILHAIGNPPGRPQAKQLLPPYKRMAVNNPRLASIRLGYENHDVKHGHGGRRGRFTPHGCTHVSQDPDTRRRRHRFANILSFATLILRSCRATRGI